MINGKTTCDEIISNLITRSPRRVRPLLNTGFLLQSEKRLHSSSILLGIGNGHFNKDEFQDALCCYERLLTEYPESESAPETIFQKGVTLYKNTHDPKVLKEAYNHLQDKYPASKWVKRAYPYRLIE